MKPAPFTYIQSESVETALSALSQHGYDAKILAGGQSLIPSMNFRLSQPVVLVDINRIDTLQGIQQNGNTIRIEAMTRQRALERSDLIVDTLPLLAEAMPYIAHPQIRNRGTIGGSLVHADPAAELPVIAVALDATIEIRSQKGTRRVPASSFFQGIFTTDLTPEELVTAIEFPCQDKQTGYAFMELARRHGDYALAGVAVLVKTNDAGICEHCRLVYLNVGEIPIDATQAAQALIGQPLTPKNIEAAAHTAAYEEIDPVGNIHASVGYQRHISKVLTKRAMQQAINRIA